MINANPAKTKTKTKKMAHIIYTSSHLLNISPDLHIWSFFKTNIILVT